MYLPTEVRRARAERRVAMGPEPALPYGPHFRRANADSRSSEHAVPRRLGEYHVWSRIAARAGRSVKRDRRGHRLTWLRMSADHAVTN